MTHRLVVLTLALLSVATPVAAQDAAASSTPPATVSDAATVRAPHRVGAVRFTIEPERQERSHFITRPAWRISDDPVARLPQKRSKAPVVGGMLLGAIAGFFGGSYLQHSFCEYDCGPGGFTWGFTAIGAAGGAAIGLLLR